MRHIKITAFAASTILITVMIAALVAGCEKIPFDADGHKIISFADRNFKERITPYFDINGDGYISIYEAQNGRRVPDSGTTEASVIMDCDNSNGDMTALVKIDEVRYFRNVEILKFAGNALSGTVDLKKLKSLKKIDFSNNAGIRKIILNTLVKDRVTVDKEPDTELEYYTDPKE